MHLDIVRFRDVNERWGSAVGDSALALVVRRALHAAPANTLLSDTGSTIIALALDATPEETHHLAAQLMVAIREPMQLGTIEVQLDVRAGYASAAAGEVGLELLDHALSAHRAAKEQDRATPAEYGEELGRETTRTQRIGAELHTAIAEGDLQRPLPARRRPARRSHRRARGPGALAAPPRPPVAARRVPARSPRPPG